MRMGTQRSRSRRWRQTSNPSTSGSPTSRITASKSHSLAIQTAPPPVAWTSTAYPSSRNACSSTADIFGGSSTTSSRTAAPSMSRVRARCLPHHRPATPPRAYRRRVRRHVQVRGPGAVTLPGEHETTMKAQARSRRLARCEARTARQGRNRMRPRTSPKLMTPDPAQQILRAHVSGGCGHQPDAVRPRDRVGPAALMPDPWDDATVVEPQPQYRSHRHLPAQAHRDANEVWFVHPGWHEVDDLYLTARGDPVRLEHQGVPGVPTGGAMPARRGGERPVSGLVIVQECGERGGRVETRQAEPVD